MSMTITTIGDIMEKLKCKKCGYEWVTRIKDDPKECPNCKSRGWKG